MAGRHRNRVPPKRKNVVHYCECIECGMQATPAPGSEVYPHRPDLADLTFYRCQCGALVGSHKRDGRPLGKAAGPETRQARRIAHQKFDPIWREKHMDRAEAYDWLSRQLGMTRLDCHIGRMNREQAEQVATLAKAKLEALRDAKG